MPFCTQCGNRNPEGSRFCSQCGSPLASAPAPDPAPAVAEPAAPTAFEPAVEHVADEPAVQAPPPSVTDSSATITFGVAQTDDDRGLDDDDAAAVDALPTGSALLVVQRGPGAGNRFLLDQEVVTAGRHPDSEIFLDDITVSRRHVEFRSAGDGYTVTDVGSLNGTYVNRDRIEESTLQNGDEVQIGKFRLVFFAGDGHQDI